MVKIFFSCLTMLLLVGCSGTIFKSNTKGVAPVNFYTVQDFDNTNRYIFDCDFSKINGVEEKARPYCVRFCQDQASCSGMDANNYISYFISFNYQNVPLNALDYAINSFKFMENDGLTAEKKLMINFFTNNTSALNTTTSTFAANLSANKFIPYTFAIEKPDKGQFSIFISKQDIFLRNKIYPSLKILSLQKPDNPAQINSLSKYDIEYSVFPHVFEVQFDDNWVSEILGVPHYSEARYNVETASQYFKEVAQGALSMNFIENGITASQKARPFDFKEKLANQSAYAKNSLKPAFGTETGLINEYLPYYELEKIEIVKKSTQAGETPILVVDKNAIKNLLETSSFNEGIVLTGTKNNGDKIFIRFIHKAMPPKFLNLGVIRSINSGLRDIYATLSAEFISDLNINKFYDFNQIPKDCLNKALSQGILDEGRINGYDIKNLTEVFKDSTSLCEPRELFMMKVILMRGLL